MRTRSGGRSRVAVMAARGVRRRLHGPMAAQQQLQDAAHLGVVFDDQDARCALGRLGSGLGDGGRGGRRYGLGQRSSSSGAQSAAWSNHTRRRYGGAASRSIFFIR